MTVQSRAAGERGSATVWVVALSGVLAAIGVAAVLVGAQLRCVDAAREGARAAARGEDTSLVTTLAGRAAPDGAATAVAVGGATVTVTVTAEVAPLGPVPLRVPVSASAVAQREPGTAEAPG